MEHHDPARSISCEVSKRQNLTRRWNKGLCSFCRYGRLLPKKCKVCLHKQGMFLQHVPLPPQTSCWGARRSLSTPPSVDVASSLVVKGLSSLTTCHPIYFPNLFRWRLSKTLLSFFSFRIRDASADAIFKLQKHPHNLLMLLFFFSHTCWEGKCVGIFMKTQTGPRRVYEEREWRGWRKEGRGGVWRKKEK